MWLILYGTWWETSSFSLHPCGPKLQPFWFVTLEKQFTNFLSKVNIFASEVTSETLFLYYSSAIFPEFFLVQECAFPSFFNPVAEKEFK